MSNIKISIVYDFHTGPWGGANQFLKALKQEFINRNFYVDNPKDADCILFNSHHSLKRILQLKLCFREKIFLHRVDGPIFLIRKKNYEIDKQIYEINNHIADATIFQSKWSKEMNSRLGMKKNYFETIIPNAVNHEIFFPKSDVQDLSQRKCKLIAASWSPSFSKGFDLYKFLDENLDFNKYSMIFVGNTPITFNNIKHVLPLRSEELAEELRNNDIFITGSRNDPCSNALIEALSCGLPCLVLNDGGHPEILGQGGEVFNTFEECIEKLELLRINYNHYRSKIKIPKIEYITKNYVRFITKILKLQQEGKYKAKEIKKINYYLIILKFQFINSSIKSLSKKFLKTIFRYLRDYRKIKSLF
ncbi:MAG: glycosyltransferase [Promethearchaeota archaeon]